VTSVDGGAILDALAGSALGRLVLDAAAERPGVHAVGGYVRDVRLGRPPREVDLVVEGDAGELARELATRMGGAALEHGRFGTATVNGPEGRVDLASSRAEHYPHPGSLPEVTLGAPLDQDLQRRDFTVNAIAVALSEPTGPGAPRGQVTTVPDAEADLAAGRLRVLHDASFLDDPTRLLRLARYAERLGFDVEPHTAELLADAVASGALATVTPARVGTELRLALAEPDPVAGLERMDRLGLLSAIDGRLDLDAGVARRARELMPEPSGLVALAVAVRGFGDRDAVTTWLDALEFPAGERNRILDAALDSPELARRLEAATRPSEIYTAAAGRPDEEVAVAGALGPQAPARQWLGELRHVTLEIGRRLRAALARRLDGELAPGRQAELEAALAA
jgi:tRNA nucleotidyltransferase (CCA-adding enzyme)